MVGGLEGDQFKKLDWLSCMTSVILAETAYDLEPAMDGARMRGELIRNLARGQQRPSHRGGGTRRMVPWMQFAINPVELHHATKVELQGEVRPEGLPIVIDASKFLPATLQCFTRVRSAGGTTVMVPEIIERI